MFSLARTLHTFNAPPLCHTYVYSRSRLSLCRSGLLPAPSPPPTPSPGLLPMLVEARTTLALAYARLLSRPVSVTLCRGGFRPTSPPRSPFAPPSPFLPQLWFSRGDLPSFIKAGFTSLVCLGLLQYLQHTAYSLLHVSGFTHRSPQPFYPQLAPSASHSFTYTAMTGLSV